MLRYKEYEELHPSELNDSKMKIRYINVDETNITDVEIQPINDYEMEIHKYNSLLEHLEKIEESRIKLIKERELEKHVCNNEQNEFIDNVDEKNEHSHNTFNNFDQKFLIIERVHDIHYDCVAKSFGNSCRQISLLRNNTIDEFLNLQSNRNKSVVNESILENGLYTSFINPINTEDRSFTSYAQRGSNMNMSITSMDKEIKSKGLFTKVILKNSIKTNNKIPSSIYIFIINFF